MCQAASRPPADWIGFWDRGPTSDRPFNGIGLDFGQRQMDGPALRFTRMETEILEILRCAGCGEIPQGQHKSVAALAEEDTSIPADQRSGRQPESVCGVAFDGRDPPVAIGL